MSTPPTLSAADADVESTDPELLPELLLLPSRPVTWAAIDGLEGGRVAHACSGVSASETLRFHAFEWNLGSSRLTLPR